MKIAITSQGNSLSANIDPRFGRCSFFAIYDTVSGATDFIANPAKESSEGAGPAAVQFVAAQGVTKIIAGEFGGKVRPLLESLNIEMKNEEGKSINQIISEL